jgi:hypothetical protein
MTASPNLLSRGAAADRPLWVDGGRFGNYENRDSARVHRADLTGIGLLAVIRLSQSQWKTDTLVPDQSRRSRSTLSQFCSQIREQLRCKTTQWLDCDLGK